MEAKTVENLCWMGASQMEDQDKPATYDSCLDAVVTGFGSLGNRSNAGHCRQCDLFAHHHRARHTKTTRMRWRIYSQRGGRSLNRFCVDEYRISYGELCGVRNDSRRTMKRIDVRWMVQDWKNYTVPNIERQVSRVLRAFGEKMARLALIRLYW